MIFQDPISSLNPRRNVRDSVKEPLDIWQRGTARGALGASSTRCSRTSASIPPAPPRAGRTSSAAASASGSRSPAALVLDPTLIICDEPVSALDVSVQAQVLNLLEDLKAQYGLTLIFIAHDLAVVKNVSDRVAVMYLGKLCEVAASDDLYRRPAHHYTKVLLDSIPVPDPQRRSDRHGDHRRAAVTGQPADRDAGSTPAARAADRACASTTEPMIAPARRRPLRRLPPPLVTPVSLN